MFGNRRAFLGLVLLLALAILASPFEYNHTAYVPGDCRARVYVSEYPGKLRIPLPYKAGKIYRGLTVPLGLGGNSLIIVPPDDNTATIYQHELIHARQICQNLSEVILLWLTDPNALELEADREVVQSLSN